MLTKPTKLYYSISEISDIFGIAPHILRFWENEFRILSPRRSSAGVRQYQLRDLVILNELIDLLYHKKFTIAGAKIELRVRRPQIDKKIAAALQSGADFEAFVTGTVAEKALENLENKSEFPILAIDPVVAPSVNDARVDFDRVQPDKNEQTGLQTLAIENRELKAQFLEIKKGLKEILQVLER